jgi:hypothetical protein
VPDSNTWRELAVPLVSFRALVESYRTAYIQDDGTGPEHFKQRDFRGSGEIAAHARSARTRDRRGNSPESSWADRERVHRALSRDGSVRGYPEFDPDQPLSEGDAEAADSVGRETAKRLGLSDKECDALGIGAKK